MKKDERLIIGAKNLDNDILAEIYDLYSPEIYRYAYRQLGSQDLAEDCVSETFSRLLNILKRGKGPKTHLKAYLYRIAHNWITDQYRKKSRAELPLDIEIPVDQDQAPETIAGKSFQKAQIRRALQYLTPDQRQVIVLKFLQGWQNPEIAEAMKRPVGAVKALQHRGLKTLRQILDKEDL